MEGRWWYESLESCGIDEQFQFSYALIYQGDRPVGMALIFLMDVPIYLVMPPALLPTLRLLEKLFPKVIFQRTLFVDSPCADEVTVGILPEIDRHQAFIVSPGSLGGQSRRSERRACWFGRTFR